MIVAQVNQFRSQQGKPELQVHPRLEQAAHDYAQILAHFDKLSHTVDGSQPWDRAVQHGYDYCIILENIAEEFNSQGFATQELVADFVKGWKQSPGHRKNMLDPDVMDTGVGVARSETGKYYAVQMFGRPKTAEIAFDIANQAGVEVSLTVDGRPQNVPPDETMTFRRCRPAEVRFADGQVFHPRNGAHYVVQKSSTEGGYTVVEE